MDENKIYETYISEFLTSALFISLVIYWLRERYKKNMEILERQKQEADNKNQ